MDMDTCEEVLAAESDWLLYDRKRNIERCQIEGIEDHTRKPKRLEKNMLIQKDNLRNFFSSSSKSRNVIN